MTVKQRIELEVKKAQVALAMRELLDNFLEEVKAADPKIKAADLEDISQWICETVFPNSDD
jgi:hypothetical protein